MMLKTLTAATAAALLALSGAAFAQSSGSVCVNARRRSGTAASGSQGRDSAPGVRGGVHTLAELYDLQWRNRTSRLFVVEDRRISPSRVRSMMPRTHEELASVSRRCASGRITRAA